MTLGLITRIEKEREYLSRKLKDDDLPEMNQANISGMIIELEQCLAWAKECQEQIEMTVSGHDCEVCLKRIRIAFNGTDDREEVKPIILDNNPLSLARYAEEYPENWKAMTEKSGSNHVQNHLDKKDEEKRGGK